MILAQITHQIIPATAMAMLSAAITTAALVIAITTAEIVGRDRGRDRNRDRGQREEREIVIGPDDVLLPVGGLLDILDSFAFIRTGGYLPSPNDVYVSLQQVRKYGLRKGDVITGSVREPKEGERREKFSALVKVETVNGNEPDTTKERVEFSKLVPLYPQDRLRLETEPNVLTQESLI